MKPTRSLSATPSRLARRLVPVAAVAALAVPIAASPAGATVIDTDDVRILGVGVDFGKGVFANGAPPSAGTLEWDSTLGVVTPRLRGTLYLKNAIGTCAKMRLIYRDSAGTDLATRSGGTVCAPTNGLHQWSVNLKPYGDPAVFEVEVQTTVQNSGGGFNVAGSQVETL